MPQDVELEAAPRVSGVSGRSQFRLQPAHRWKPASLPRSGDRWHSRACAPEAGPAPLVSPPRHLYRCCGTCDASILLPRPRGDVPRRTDLQIGSRAVRNRDLSYWGQQASNIHSFSSFGGQEGTDPGVTGCPVNMAQRAHLVACGAPIALHGSVRVTERFDVLQSVCDGLSPPRTQPHRSTSARDAHHGIAEWRTSTLSRT